MLILCNQKVKPAVHQSSFAVYLLVKLGRLNLSSVVEFMFQDGLVAAQHQVANGGRAAESTITRVMAVDAIQVDNRLLFLAEVDATVIHVEIILLIVFQQIRTFITRRPTGHQQRLSNPLFGSLHPNCEVKWRDFTCPFQWRVVNKSWLGP